jgi:hypothetical protein
MFRASTQRARPASFTLTALAAPCPMSAFGSDPQTGGFALDSGQPWSASNPHACPETSPTLH